MSPKGEVNTMNTMMLRFFSCLTTLLLLASVAVAQDTAGVDAEQGADVQRLEGEDVDKVLLLLSGYDYFPTRADLERVSPRAVEILIAFAQDEAALPSLRTRALDALGFFSDDFTSAVYFETVLAAGALEDVFAQHAINACMKAHGQRALPWVVGYLEAPEIQTRLSAIHAIGEFGGLEGRDVLKLRKPLERDVFVLKTVERFTR